MQSEPQNPGLNPVASEFAAAEPAPVIDDSHPARYRPILRGEFRGKRSGGACTGNRAEVRILQYRG